MKDLKILFGAISTFIFLSTSRLVLAPEVFNDLNLDQRYDRYEQLKEKIKVYTNEEKASLFAEWILKYSERHLPSDFDLNWVCALFAVESSFRADAVNPSDPAFGLGQILIPTARWIAKELDVEFPKKRSEQVRFLLNPERNIQFSLFYLGYCKRKFKNQSLAIAAYNGVCSLRSEYLLRVRRILRKFKS